MAFYSPIVNQFAKTVSASFVFVFENGLMVPVGSPGPAAKKCATIPRGDRATGSSYCPQPSPIWPLVEVRETLHLPSVVHFGEMTIRFSARLAQW